MVARELITEDAQDINFSENGKLMINGAYHVYDQGVSVQQGGAQYVDWRMPMFAFSSV